jgi:GTP-binding protein
MRFVDEATITVRSGHGGHGCVSFRREAHVPKGGPDGGNGGKGGDVIFRASDKLLTLYDFRLKRLYEARNGQPGMGRQRHGKNAEDLVIDVPVGTLLYRLDGPDGADDPGDEDNFDTHDAAEAAAIDDADGAQAPDGASRTPGGATLVADLTEPGREVVLCRGGRGGMGNEHFKTSTMRTPRFAQPGEDGEEMTLRLELKVIAHAGLLGLPNAGKSTFLSRISAARPKIAAYPFTTLVPNLGVLLSDMGEHFVVADIPGLIEGAHLGQGLGHRFLRHVERTLFLVHLLSAEELDEDDPFAGFALLNDELARYSPELGTKMQLEVVNKIDVLPPERLEELTRRAKAEGREVFFISALTGAGVDRLLAAMWRLFRAGRNQGAQGAAPIAPGSVPQD